MKVSKLKGYMLDYWVARANGMKKGMNNYVGYSTHWAAGGPIIEEHKILVDFDRTFDSNEPWRCSLSINPHDKFEGSTVLIAAMRCFVASRFGETVDDSQTGNS